MVLGSAAAKARDEADKYSEAVKRYKDTAIKTCKDTMPSYPTEKLFKRFHFMTLNSSSYSHT